MGNDNSQYRKMHLKPGKERSLRNFHPWIFSGAFERDDREGVPGETVQVIDPEGRVLATGHYHPATIMVRVLAFGDRNIDKGYWKDKITKAADLRRQAVIPADGSTNAYRLLHAEGDHVPGLIIDKYDKCCVIQTHTTGMLREVNAISEALEEVVAPDTIYHKSSADPEASGSIKGTEEKTTIMENGCSFIVNWREGQKTGFFIDQRDNRFLVSKYASGRKVLNAFCYSGGFSVYAAKGGANSVDSVDSSSAAVDWCEQNMEMNGYEGSIYNSHNTDVFNYLKNMKSDYDLVILDPPAFAKHRDSIPNALKGYTNLNFEAIRKMPSDSILFTFSCSQAISSDDFRKAVFKASARAGRSVRVLHRLSQPADHPVNIYHPEGEYLKGLVLHIS
jgi:23S rRNA (cytosine1962-C5)-methyltransferase